VLQDAVFGQNAALGCHMANESYYRKSRCIGTQLRRASSHDGGSHFMRRQTVLIAMVVLTLMCRAAHIPRTGTPNRTPPRCDRIGQTFPGAVGFDPESAGSGIPFVVGDIARR